MTENLSNLSTFSIERPQFLLLILALVPALIIFFARFKKISAFSRLSSKNIFVPVTLRVIFRSVAWIFAILALSRVSFGTKKVPVQKNGTSVTFVFDISYSMLAPDCPKKMTRLEAVKLYASSLVENLDGCAFSAVLAKGSGYTAIPETEDKAAILNLIENLSPLLMTSSGSSLGKGLEAALSEISLRSQRFPQIWIFTDGDETDRTLEKSLGKAVESGIPVTIVGFGSENETEITSGDGKTKVKTALRSQKIRDAIQSAISKNYASGFSQKNSLLYIDSRSQGSAARLLKQVSNTENSEKTVGFETKKVKRHKFFMFFALIFLILSFFAGEFRLSSLKNLGKLMIFTATFPFFSCKSEKKQILDGSWAWQSGKYTEATADFLTVAAESPQNSMAQSYAVFALSSTYLSMGEFEAALDRLSEINLDDKNLPKELRSAAFYNRGVIFEKQGKLEEARHEFKKAVLADFKNKSAKINLEFCEREIVQKRTKSAESEMQGVTEEKNNKSLESEIFTLIREQEGKKWRNMTGGGDESKSGEIDF